MQITVLIIHGQTIYLLKPGYSCEVFVVLTIIPIFPMPLFYK